MTFLQCHESSGWPWQRLGIGSVTEDFAATVHKAIASTKEHAARLCDVPDSSWSADGSRLFTSGLTVDLASLRQAQ